MGDVSGIDISGFDFSVSAILASLFFGVVGLYYMRQGRKFANFKVMLTGVAMMIYPYFVSGDKLTWFVGFALWGGAYYFQNYI